MEASSQSAVIEKLHNLAHLPIRADELVLSLFAAKSEQVSETTGKIRFFPDGSFTGGRVGLARGQQKYHVTVDWLTGPISIVD